MTLVSDEDNLLVQLHKRVSKQDENFLTDAFGHLLRHLCRHEPDVAVRVLFQLTQGRLHVGAENLCEVQISTQVTTEQGRPDLEIRSVDHLVFVEAKKESRLGDRQMSRYRHDLARSGFPETTLILLTRYLVEPSEHERPDVLCRWYQVAAWLHAELEAGTLKEQISIFLVGQFVGFLRARNMTMEQVKKDLVGGVRSLRSLLAMLAEAIASHKSLRYRLESTLDYAGYYVNGGEFFVGLYHDWPGLLFFETWKYPVRADADKQAGFGYIESDKEAPTGKIWADELQLEDVHFFDLPREQQMQCIEKFLGRCLRAVPRVKAQTTT